MVFYCSISSIYFKLHITVTKYIEDKIYNFKLLIYIVNRISKLRIGLSPITRLISNINIQNGVLKCLVRPLKWDTHSNTVLEPTRTSARLFYIRFTTPRLNPINIKRYDNDDHRVDIRNGSLTHPLLCKFNKR